MTEYVDNMWATVDTEELNPKEEGEREKKKILLQNCNTIDKRHTAYNGRAALHKLRTISHRQHPGKRRKRPWADTTKLGPGKIPKSSRLLIPSSVGGEGSSLLPAHVYRAVLISRPCSSTALTHGVDMIRGLPLHRAACVCGGWRIGRWMTLVHRRGITADNRSRLLRRSSQIWSLK